MLQNNHFKALFSAYTQKRTLHGSVTRALFAHIHGNMFLLQLEFWWKVVQQLFEGMKLRKKIQSSYLIK